MRDDSYTAGMARPTAMVLWLLALFASPLLLAKLTAAEAAPAQEAAADAENPYLARPGLSRGELSEFLSAMCEKPESVRRRPGFYAAVVDAADRVIALSTTAESATDALATQALLAKFAALHNQSLNGESKADAALAELAGKFEKDPRGPVAAEAGFHLLERRALTADKLPSEGLAPLLVDLKRYFSSSELKNRDVRMASATVAVINRLPDEKAAADDYREFGGWFAKSKDPELARYGRKIEKGPKIKAGEKATAPKE